MAKRAASAVTTAAAAPMPVETFARACKTIATDSVILLTLPFDYRQLKQIAIRGRHQIMFAKFRHRKLTWLLRLQKPSLPYASQFLFIDLALQFHECGQKRFRPRRTPGNINIDRDVAVDSFEHVVSLLERTSRDRARAHGDNIFRIGHLIIEAHDLWRHFLCHCPRNNHQVGLPWRRPKNFTPKSRDVIARRSGCDHFNGAASQAKLQWPDGVLAPPVIKLLHRSHPDSLPLQFAA